MIDIGNFALYSDLSPEKVIFRAEGTGSEMMYEVPNTTGKLMWLYIMWRPHGDFSWATAEMEYYDADYNATDSWFTMSWECTTTKIYLTAMLPNSSDLFDYRICGVEL